MKKKLLCWFFSIALAAALMGCGASKQAAEGNEVSDKDSIAESEKGLSGTAENAEDKDVSAKDEAGEKEAPEAVSKPKAIIVTKSYYEYDEQEEALLFSGFNQGVLLAEESKADYPGLYDALQKAWEDDLKASNESAERLTKESRDQLHEMREYDPNREYVLSYEENCSANIHRVDSRVFSFSFSMYSYMGGVHGMYGNSGRTYEAQTGKSLALADVITDLEAFGERLYDKVSVEYPDVVDYLEDPTTIREQIIEELKNAPDTWELEPDGIVYFFNPYDIAAYASGEQIIKVSYKEAPDIFSEKYLPEEGTDYLSSVPNGKDFRLDMDGDGKPERFTLEEIIDNYEYDGEMYDTVGYKIVEDDGTETRIGEDGDVYGCEGYYASFAEGKTFLLLDCEAMNDYHVVYVCSLERDGIQELDSYGVYAKNIGYDDDTGLYGQYAFTDPSLLELTEHFDRLSTFFAGGEYYLSKEGVIEPKGEYAVIGEEAREFFVLTSKAALTVDIVDEGGKVVEKDIELPAGTDFQLYRTAYKEHNGAAIVDAYLTDGRIARIYYEIDEDYNRTVNGIDEWDAFGELFYAG
ncbi:MAG: DUF3298 domain-containing protein [Lachnospiraceae bacterium]|nr:DUF3298 domain-containing protein [Lachnospiraceae bacterium]